MPANLRGDFAYMDAGNRIVSNNPALIPYIKATHGVSPSAIARSLPSAIRPMDYSSSCSPPGSQTGPYVRDVSVCGMTAGWGFVNTACGYTNLALGDEGQLYFELRGSNGSLSEGGLQYNSDSSIQPYMRTDYTNPSYQTMGNSDAHYQCDQTLTIIHGVAYSSAGFVTYTMVGQLPSDIDPATQWVNMNSQFFIPDNVSWLWLNAPSDITGAETNDGAGNPSPCMNCSISKVTSIAQTSAAALGGIDYDGSQFGSTGFPADGDELSNYIQWMEVGFGQYATSCVESGANSTCQLEAGSPSQYYGGQQCYPDWS